MEPTKGSSAFTLNSIRLSTVDQRRTLNLKSKRNFIFYELLGIKIYTKLVGGFQLHLAYPFIGWVTS